MVRRKKIWIIIGSILVVTVIVVRTTVVLTKKNSTITTTEITTTSEGKTVEIKESSTMTATQPTSSIERLNGMFTLDSSCVHQQKKLFPLQINAIEHIFPSRTMPEYFRCMP
jgi:hypothetical protein